MRVGRKSCAYLSQNSDMEKGGPQINQSVRKRKGKEGNEKRENDGKGRGGGVVYLFEQSSY